MKKKNQEFNRKKHSPSEKMIKRGTNVKSNEPNNKIHTDTHKNTHTHTHTLNRTRDINKMADNLWGEEDCQ